MTLCANPLSGFFADYLPFGGPALGTVDIIDGFSAHHAIDRFAFVLKFVCDGFRNDLVEFDYDKGDVCRA